MEFLYLQRNAGESFSVKINDVVYLLWDLNNANIYSIMNTQQDQENSSYTRLAGYQVHTLIREM